MSLNKIFIFTLLTISFNLSYANNTTKYKAYECISYIHFDWGDYKGDKTKIFNKTGEYDIQYNMLLFVSSYNIKLSGDRFIKDDSGMYLLYDDNCEKKTQMSEKIMQYYKKNIKNWPKYFVTNAIIAPNVNYFN